MQVLPIFLFIYLFFFFLQSNKAFSRFLGGNPTYRNEGARSVVVIVVRSGHGELS